MIRARYGFGCESAFSGARGPELLERMQTLGYELHGVFLGTEDPAINIRRIQWRVDAHTGHWVSSERVAVRWHWALSNLRKHAVQFDRLSILDNSAEDVDHAPVTRDIAKFEKGRMTWAEVSDQRPVWFREWLSGFEHRQKDPERLERKRRRGMERMDVSPDRESGPSR